MEECWQMLLLTSNSAGVILKACPRGWCCHDIHERAMQGCVPWEAETNSAF